MKVAFVTYAMLWGGMETFLLRLGRFLLQRGIQVDVVTTSESGEWFCKLGEAGLGARYLRRRSLTEVGHAFRVGRFLARSGYDVVFLNHARHAQMSLGLLPDAVIAIPILHNDAPPIYEVGCANPHAWNVVVGVSPKICSEAQRRVGRTRIVRIGYGVEVPVWEEVVNRRPASDKFRLTFAGRLVHEQKGVLLLPEIFDQLSRSGVDAELTILGEGPDREAMEREFKARLVYDRVRFDGLVSPAAVYERLSTSDVLLMPSFYEGFGLVMLEAMACGCVPVVSRLPGVTDSVVRDGITGVLAEPGDPSSFAKAAAHLAANRPLWNAMSAAAHEEALLHGVDAMGQKYLDLITACLDGQYPLPRGRRPWFPLDPAQVRRSDLRPHLVYA